MTILHTARLRLEPFADAHFEGLAAMNSRPEVMRHISGKAETPEETRAAITRVKARWVEWGYSWFAFVLAETGQVIGAGCVQHLGGERSNPLEVGWRLHPDHWGKGYAIEAARALVAHAFDALKAPQVLAIRHPDNTDSAKVMAKLGMQQRHQLERWHDVDCAVHEISAAQWRAQHGRAN